MTNAREHCTLGGYNHLYPHRPHCSSSLGKQRPVLSQLGERSGPAEGPGDRTGPCDEEHTGAATPDPDEGAASGGFVAVSPIPPPQAGSQEWVMLELESGSGSASAGAKPALEPLHLGDKSPASPSADPGDGQPISVPSSPVLSHMSMPGSWLMGHRRLTGMTGMLVQIPSGRSLDQVSPVR